ncbi:phosphatidylinositol-specific phospholipase C/glycerophosphodiester phosphodiesterase family protein [candidate division KSB1 bacterium]|nr:phosphatidylinositol-specific phospholipase C/glycerophosphodiester phosphodiesterase family protein [candidate division KSB1 bacterium]
MQLMGIFLSLMMCISNFSELYSQALNRLERAHAHNDYRHKRPLQDALEHGFSSIEVDIYLRNNELYVAHDHREIRPNKTLTNLYLEPLREIIHQNHGWVFQDKTPITLLIDIKTNKEATYRRLCQILSKYRDFLTTFTPSGVHYRAVTIIISGNRPLKMMLKEKVRYAGYDGRLEDLTSRLPLEIMPLISENAWKIIPSTKLGIIREAEFRKLKQIVDTAHQAGRKVRLWATPDSPSVYRTQVWNRLLAIGVDYINTDDLGGLKEFLVQNKYLYSKS